MKALVGCLNCALKGIIGGVFYSKTPDGQICCPILKCCVKMCVDEVKVGIEHQEVEMAGEHAPPPVTMS
jgi:hypothetical protein